MKTFLEDLTRFGVPKTSLLLVKVRLRMGIVVESPWLMVSPKVVVFFPCFNLWPKRKEKEAGP